MVPPTIGFPRSLLSSVALPALVVALLATLLIVGPVGQAEAQAVVPFDCDGTPYIMQNSRMYQVVPDPANPGLFLFEEVGIAANYGNSIGFDPTTNLVYGVRRIGGVWTVLTYDSTWGTVNSQPMVSITAGKPFPTAGSNYAGTVLGDGRYIVATYNAPVTGSTRHNLWSIDAATGDATWIGAISPQSPSLADFAYNPADGYMYHVTQGNLHQLNPLTGAKINLGPVPGTASGYGSSYFDAAGNLFIHQNSGGDLVKVSGIGTGTYTSALVATTGRVSGADAASCVGELDLLKDVVDPAGNPVPLADRTYAPGEVVLYAFTIINNALPSGPQSLNLCDVLPADGRSYTGVATSAAPFSFNPPITPGDTNFCLDVTVPSSLWTDPLSPGGDPVTITVEVELGPDMVPGEYANQATLESPFDPGDLVFSDDPGDVSDPEDATTINVTGEFSVAKEVATHPDGNDTDTFTIAVTCTDAEGVPFDVTPDMIVDAMGVPWPGASTNMFPIKDGEQPRVVDLPANAICSAVEAPIPAAYALTAESNDVSLAAGGEMVIDDSPGNEGVRLRNLTGEFSLAKFVFAPASVAAPLDLNGSFPIQVQCRLDGVVVLDTVFTVPVTDGVSGTLSYPDLPLLPHGAECRAVEQVPGGWDGSTDPVSFEIDLAIPALAEFRNTRQVAPLDITKTISGLPAGTDDTDFAFEVTITCASGFLNPSETFGPFTIRTDDPESQPDLPVGSSCVVVEAPSAGFSPVYAPGGGAVTIAEAGSSVAIDNVTGTLIIQKNTVVPTVPPIDPTGDFDFSMNCTDGGTSVFNGTVTVSVTDTAPAAGATGGITYGDPQIPLLPPGTECTITEIVPAGWTLTSAPSVTITIPADGVPPTAVFSNERPTADLTLTKTVAGLPEGVDPASFSFPVTVVCSHESLVGDYTVGPLTLTPGTDLTAADLPVGASCVATEAPDDRFTPSLPADPTVIGVDGSTLAIVNTTQALTIEKTATADDPTIDLSGTFPFTVVCDNGVTTNVTVTTDASGAGVTTYPDLPLYADGTICTVTETVPSDWTLTSGNDVEVVLGGGNTGTPAGTPANGAVVSDNCQDGGGNAPFNLQIRNTTGNPIDWQMVWTNRPYATIPGLNPGNYTHTVIDNGDGTYNHVFTGTTTLGAYQNATITGGTPSPAGDNNCGTVEHFIVGGGDTGDGDDAAGGEAAPGTAAFTNNRNSADLTVSKTIVGLPAGESSSGYSFTVDVTCTGDFVGGSRTFNDVTLTTAGAVIEDLPTGALCTIAEDPSAGFTASYPDGDSETITAVENTVAIVNTTSTFAIEKATIVPAGVEQDATFGFAWTCDDPAATAGTGTLTTVNGAGAMTFADGLPLVPPGTTCSIDETSLPAGWVVAASPLNVTTSAGAIATASFENTRLTGEIVISKSIVGLPSGADPADFDFEVTVTCTGDFDPLLAPMVSTFQAGETILIEDLPTGADCTVAESPDPQWTPLYSPTAGELVIAEGQNDVAIVNSTGELIVFKENFVPTTQQIDPLEQFDFEITCRFNGVTVFGPQVFVLDANSTTLTGSVGGIGYDELGTTFEPGTVCSVEELLPPAGWTIVTAPNPVEVEITTDGGATAQFENRRDVGPLTITKQIDGLPDGVDPASFTFDLVVECSHPDLPANYQPTPVTGSLPLTISAGTPIEFADLPTGAVCTVDESALPEFAPTLPDAVTIDSDGETLELINTTRTLTINKTTSTTSPLPVDLRADFDFTVVCDNGYSTAATVSTDTNGNGSTSYPSIGLLAAGTECTVTEDVALPAGWTLSTANDVVVDTTADDGSAAFTNTRTLGQLIIDKTVIGLPAGQPAPSFTVDVVCTGEFFDPTATPSNQYTFSAVALPVTGTIIGGLPTGTSCEIEENPDNSYLPSYPAGTTAEIDADGETLEIVNETSTFEMLKTTQVPTGVSDAATFTFVWSCNDPALSSGTATRTGAGPLSFSAGPPLVPVGTECTVTEDPVPTGWTATTNPAVITTASGGPVTAEIVNTRDTGSLTITKAIEGFPGTPGSLDDEPFTITVTCVGDFTPPTAVFTRTVTVNSPVIIPDLPVGATCSVVEDPDSRFFVVYAPGTTTITSGANSLAVVNVTGELIVQKNTIVNSPHPVSAGGTFPVRIICSDSNGVYFDELLPVTIDMETATATGSVGTGGIRYDDIPLLSDGSICTVAEENIPSGWTETTSPPPGDLEIDSAAPVTAVLENTRDVGTLTITKAIEGLPADIDPASFSFDITVSCSGGGLAANYEIPITIVPGTPYPIEQLPTGATCTALEDNADPQFAPTYPPAPTEIIAAGATLPIVNTTTAFSLTKTTSTSSALPIDLAESFVFTVECGSELPVTVMVVTNSAGAGAASHTTGLPLVAPGTLCTVTEAARPGWTETSTIAPFTTVAGVAPQLDFTNARDLATLTIEKDFVGLPSSVVQTGFSFTVDVSCTGGFSTVADPYQTSLPLSVGISGSAVLTGIPTGATCTVVEQLPATSPFVASYSPSSGAVTLSADATVDVTNTTSTFAIAKTTVVPALADPDATFAFAYTCTDPAASGGTATITTAGGLGSFTFDSDPANQLPLLPPGTTCEIDETALPTGWVATETPLAITTSGDAVVEAAFVNTRQSSTLTISKTILGLTDLDDPPASFEFDVEIVCVGDFPDTGDGVGTLTLARTISTDNDIVVPNLPSGATCTITEDPEASGLPFAALYGPENADGTAAEVTLDSPEVGASITNLTGRVAWVKQTVVPPQQNINPVATFSFQVECTTPGGATTVQTVEITTMNVTAAGAVGVPDEADFPLLPAGTVCTITELGPDAGWSLTSTSNPAAPINPVTVVISPDPNPGTFTNERDAADLTITKVIEGLPDSVSPTMLFEVNVTCSHPDLQPPMDYLVGPLLIGTTTPATVANLPTGAVCMTVETSNAEYATSYENQTVTITDGETTIVTNSTGTLEVTKTTTAADPTLVDLSGEFTFDIVCGSVIDTEVTITTNSDGNGSVGYPTIGLIPEGQACTVTEQGPPIGWTTADAIITETVTNGLARTVFTNTRDTATLTVTKVIEGGPAGILDAELFGLIIECDGDFPGGSYAPTGAAVSVDVGYTLENLPSGADCTVAEVPDPQNRFSVSYSPDPADVTIDPGNGASVVITNATGELIVNKETVIPPGRQIDPTGTFVFSFECVNPLTSIPVFSGQRSVVVTMATATSTGATAGIRYADLPLMPDGTECTITELPDPLGLWTLTSGNVQLVTISSSNPVTADFLNTRNTATLQITKELAGLPLGAIGDFNDELFTVTITCTGDFVGAGIYATIGTVSVNGALSIDNLPTGAQCSITESDDPRFSPSYAPQTILLGDGGAATTITNTTGELVLMKETIVPSEHPLDPVATFNFDLVCTSPGATSPLPTLALQVTPDVTTQTGAIGGIRYDEIPLFADGTMCVVTETGLPSDWTLSSDNNVEIEINSSAPVTAPFVNTHDVGDLIVTKETLGLPADITASSRSFSVTATCNHPSLPANYQIDFVLSGSDSHTIEALPANAVCVVEEGAQTEYATAYSPTDGQVTIVKDDVVSVDIVNETSYFSLTKTAVTTGDLANLANDFVFDISCSNGFADQFIITTTSAGTGSLDHTDGLPLLPPDATCSIIEASANLPAGWIYQSPSDGQSSPTVTQGDRGDVTFVNEREVAPLTITKLIEGLPASIQADTQIFGVTVSCDGDFANSPEQVFEITVNVASPVVLDNLPTGASCEVVEDPAPAYTTSTSPESGVANLEGTTGGAVAITNSTATFTVTKQTTVTSDLPIDLDATFVFDYSCTSPAGDVLATGSTTLTTVGGTATNDFDTATPDNLPMLPHGTICTITERPVADWTPTSDVEQVVTLDSSQVRDVEFTNDRDVVELTVAKEIVGLPASLDPDSFAFPATVTCSGAFTDGQYSTDITLSTSEAITLAGVPASAVCTLTENLPTDSPFAASYDPISGSVALDADGTITATNTTSTFEIAKATIVPDTAEDDATFTFTWECTDTATTTGTTTITTVDGTGVFAHGIGDEAPPLLAPGTECEIREVAIPTGWNGDQETQTVVSAVTPPTAAFENTRSSGDLEISKSIVGLLPSDPAPESFSFLVDITCEGDFPGGNFAAFDQPVATNSPLQLSGLPTNAVCVIVEQTPVGFGFTPVYNPAASTGDSAEITIAAGTNGVAITNQAGRASWIKQTIVPSTHPIDPVATFSFEVICTAPDGTVFSDIVDVTTSELTATGAVGVPTDTDFPAQPVGSSCIIEELDAGPEWALVSDPNPIELVVTEATEPAQFVNERQTGALTVSNTVIGLPAGADPADYPFTFTLMCSDGGLPEGYMFGPFTLLPGESITFDDLPIGSICKVLQDPDNRFRLDLPDSVEILAGEVANLPVVNRTGTLSIEKIADAPQSELSATFIFTVTCSNGYRATHELVTSTEGTGSVLWPTLPLLATNTTCEISELPTSGWEVQGPATVAVMIETDETATAEFQNEYLVRPSAPSAPAAPPVEAPAAPQPPQVPDPVAVTTAPDQPLALTGSSSRTLAAVAMLLISLGFTVAGLGRRRRHSATD